MSVRKFAEPAHWIMNYSGFEYSDDGGQTWKDDPSALRPNTPDLDDEFQMIAYAPRDGFVYAFGAQRPLGRRSRRPSARTATARHLRRRVLDGTGWQRGSKALDRLAPHDG